MEPSEFAIDFGSGIRGEWIGTNLWLRIPYGTDWLPSRVPIAGPHAWTVQKREPLSLYPSIRVSAGDGETIAHGYITDGRWVRCSDSPV